MAIEKYYLGCPIWSEPKWIGSLYERGLPKGDTLSQYAQVFNAVEGNTTFYSAPSPEAVQRWRTQTPASFRFSFKFPRLITHERMLIQADGEVTEFLKRISPLEERIGCFMIQLPPTFSFASLAVLADFLARLPLGFSYSVEFRHRSFYDDPRAVNQCEKVLSRYGCGRTVIDTRGLRVGPSHHPDVMAARHKKPDLPAQSYVTSGLPFLRFVGHPEIEINQPFVDSWADNIAGWIAQGHTPYVFVHTANNVHAPELARVLHQRVSEKLNVEAMPSWPGEQAKEQLGFFA